MDFKPQNCKSVKSVAEATALCQDPLMEVKLDGWRGIVIVEDGQARLFSRTAKEYTDRLPELMDELSNLPDGTILDGEVIGDSWNSVQSVLGSSVKQTSWEQRSKLIYVAFDLIELGGVDICDYELRQRRRTLEDLYERTEIPATLSVVIRTLEATQEGHDEVVAGGYEGTVIKCGKSKYRRGKRGHGWFKLKHNVEVDVVVIELPEDGKGQFAGQVGRMIVGQLQDGKLVERAAVNCPDNETRAAMTKNPEEWIGKVLTIKHYGVNPEQTFRHPTFVRWREDKPVREVTFHND